VISLVELYSAIVVLGAVLGIIYWRVGDQ
jgi:hypothetical protein